MQIIECPMPDVEIPSSVSESVMSVLTLYDSFESGCYARRQVKSIENNFSDIQIDHHLCNLNVLKIPDAGLHFKKMALEVDLIVVSVREKIKFDSFIQSWFDEWIHDARGMNKAMIGLLSSNPALRILIERFLEKTSYEGGIHYFSHIMKEDEISYYQSNNISNQYPL